jgi:SWI/SNF-related matrix-associated actin-dependent regulator of chromatin subfamily B protein 1
VTPEAFAQSLVEDYALAPSYHGVIVKSIQDQLTDFRAHSADFDHEGVELSDGGGSDAALIRGSLDDENARWWALWRRRVKKEAARALADGSDAEDEESYTKNLKKAGNRKGAVNGEKRRKVVKIKKEKPQDDDEDDDEDADVSMLADNEFEVDEEKKQAKSSHAATPFWGKLDTDGAFKPLAVDEIKVDEQAMHEEMRILIKVRRLRCCFLNNL